METERELTEQLEDVVARIAEARRELKALRRHRAAGPEGRGRANFIAGKERMLEAAEAAGRLEALKRQEAEIRSRLHSADDSESTTPDSPSV